MCNDLEKAGEILSSGGGRATSPHRAPGTFVLTLVFLAAFAVYFFANWRALAGVWHVR